MHGGIFVEDHTKGGLQGCAIPSCLMIGKEEKFKEVSNVATKITVKINMFLCAE